MDTVVAIQFNRDCMSDRESLFGVREGQGPMKNTILLRFSRGMPNPMMPGQSYIIKMRLWTLLLVCDSALLTGCACGAEIWSPTHKIAPKRACGSK